MTQQITELKLKPISDQEYEDWKSSWDGLQPVPEKVQYYIRNVLYDKIDSALSKFDL